MSFEGITTSLFSQNPHDPHSSNDENNNESNYMNSILSVILIKTLKKYIRGEDSDYASCLVYRYDTWVGMRYTPTGENNSVIKEYHTCFMHT